MLSFAFGALPVSSAILHDSTKVRAAFTCGTAGCKGADALTQGWFKETQAQLNRLGVAIYATSWKALVVDGVLGARSLAAAQMVFPKVPALAADGFAQPTSTSVLALWVRGLEFQDPSQPTMLPGQLKQYADQLTAQPAPLVASVPTPIRTAPIPPPPRPTPSTVPSGATIVPTGATAPSEPLRLIAMTQQTPAGAAAAAAAAAAAQTGVKPPMATSTKVAIGVGGGLLVVALGAVLLRR